MLRQRGAGIAKGAGKHSASSRTATTRSFNTYSDVPADAAGQVRMPERNEEKQRGEKRNSVEGKKTIKG